MNIVKSGKPIGIGIALLLIGCSSKIHNTPPSFSNEQVTQSETTVIDQTKKLFPIFNYPQNSDRWISPDDPDYRKPFLSPTQQKNAFNVLLERYFGEKSGDKSPWNSHYIQSVLQDPEGVKKTYITLLKKFTAANVSHYGENFRLLDASWKVKMQNLISVPIADEYTPSSRGITLRETALRFLPTTHPTFKDPRKAGQGYPFDMLQNSALHPGEPLYIAAVTSDKSWSFIIFPTEMGWVDSSHIAKVDDNFIQQWTSMAKKSLGR